MKKTAHEFYFKNKEKIEEWLDMALYKPERNVVEKIPNKLYYANNRNFRRFCVLRHQLRLLKLADLSRSKKVLDIGAGFGDFLILADNFNFERLDATEPGIHQYKFISEKFNYYNNVYNLPLEEISLTEYDTIILSGVWVPNWVETIKNCILPNENLKDIVISTSLLHGKNHLLLDAENIDPETWKYCYEADQKLASFNLINLIFKSKSFFLKNSYSLKNNTKNHMTSKFYLHYQRT
jgi:tRNA1(Val) A37 N6-methylase TrmN6